MEIISGGVTAPIGFLAAGMHAGVRKNKKKKDMALLVSKCPAKTAGVFTQNVVKAAPASPVHAFATPLFTTSA